MVVDISVVLTVLLLHYKEATFYFCLAVISGVLIFFSCVAGRYLSLKLSAPPRSAYYSRAHSLRSHHSIHSQHGLGPGGQHNISHSGPGPPPRLGSWTRPTTLGSKSTMCSSWTVSNPSGQDLEKQQMLHHGKQVVQLPRRESDVNPTAENFPWVFYTHQQQGGKLQIQPERQQSTKSLQVRNEERL